ncbi:MAG: hypothetical protein ACP5HK_06645 [Acidilobus sp.]
MSWWRLWRGGPWPGHGPFSYLPPWERPGWYLWGRWAYWDPSLSYPVTYDKGSELRSLEAYRLYLEDLRSWVESEIKGVEKRIAELKGGGT